MQIFCLVDLSIGVSGVLKSPTIIVLSLISPFILLAFALHMWCSYVRASLVTQMVKRLSAMLETWVQSLSWENPLEKEMATHSSTLAWKTPWSEEHGRLQSMGLQRVRHDWVTLLTYFTILGANIFFLDWSFDHYVVSFFVSFHGLYFKVYFIWYEYCYSFLLVSICKKYFFSALHFPSLCVPSLRWVSCRQHI